jgi:hypothetical protein
VCLICSDLSEKSFWEGLCRCMVAGDVTITVSYCVDLCRLH